MINLTTIDAKELWYIIGLIVADGNLSSDQRHVNITSKDIDHLEKVKKALRLKCAVSMKSRDKEKHKIYGFLQFSDVKFFAYLQTIGLHPKKSLTLQALKIEKKYFVDFLRGVIDGDGCIRSWIHKSNNHTQWSLSITSAAPIFSRWLLTTIENSFGVKGKMYTYDGKKNPINIIKFGKLASKVILGTTYYADCLSLDRKHDLAKICLGTNNGFKKYGNVITI
jgi:intein-encoded DNA endonuclease-like protein